MQFFVGLDLVKNHPFAYSIIVKLNATAHIIIWRRANARLSVISYLKIATSKGQIIYSK